MDSCWVILPRMSRRPATLSHSRSHRANDAEVPIRMAPDVCEPGYVIQNIECRSTVLSKLFVNERKAR